MSEATDTGWENLGWLWEKVMSRGGFRSEIACTHVDEGTSVRAYGFYALVRQGELLESTYRS